MPTWPTSQQQQPVGFGYKVPAQSATVSPAASGPAPSGGMSAPMVNSSLEMATPGITSMAQPATVTSSPPSSSSQAAKMSPTPIVSATSVTRMTAPILVRRPAPSAANTAAPQPATSSVVDKLADAMAAMTGGRGDTTNVSVTAAGPAAQPKVPDIRAGGAATQATSPSTGPDKILIGALVVAALAAGYLIFKKKGK